MKQITVIKKNTSPLCYLPNGKLCCYSHGNIILIHNQRIVDRFRIFESIKEKHLSKIRIINKALRLGVRSATAIDNNTIIINIRNTLFEVDLIKKSISNGYYIGQGVRPLQFSKIINIEGFEDTVVFGGYVLNPNKKPVSIYKRISTDNWEIIYTFPNKTINHIHNIVPDPYRQCVWIFTGDTEESAAIWKCTDNFKNIERFVSNNQKFRACVGWATKQGLLYATDSPTTDNYIYLLEINDNTYKLTKIKDLSGSCIYGGICNHKYVFSTTVEDNGLYKNIIQRYFNWTRGTGIKDENAHLYIGTPEQNFVDIYQEKKDLWPFIVQYGVFKIPSGLSNNNTLYFQPIATTKNDSSLLSIEL